jgi:hypothetical protein
MSLPRIIAEKNFANAAAHATLFELKIRLRAGTISCLADKPIKTKLSEVVDEIITTDSAKLTNQDVALLKTACTLRNKLLHCEFSTVRERLDPSGSQSRSGGVAIISGVTPENFMSILNQLNTESHIGQQAVATTETKKHSDVYGWLLESQGSGAFEEASDIFKKALILIERLINE